MENVFLPGRGETMHGAAVAAADYGQHIAKEGDRAIFSNTYGPNHGNSALLGKKIDSREIKAIFVRNVSGITLMPGMLCRWDTPAMIGKRVDGYTAEVADQVAGVVDDHLTMTGGVNDGDMFWLIVKGPALVRYRNDSDPAVSGGEFLHAATGTSTGNTIASTDEDDGGNAQPWDGTCNQIQTTDGTLSQYIRNVFGVAVSAATSGQLRLVELNCEAGTGTST